ncbi:T9SS type A sorting domain-containing protein [bacterium]
MSKGVRWLYALIAIFLLCGNVMTQDYVFNQMDDEWGLVVMEAEHYSDMVLPGAEYYEPVIEPDFFSGEGGMMAMPENGVFADATSALINAPVMNYFVNFVKADSVFIWTRGCHEGGGDDSYHAGIDGEILPTTERIGYHGEPNGVWDWLGIAMSESKPVFYIDTPGIHVFSVYMREGGFKFDKFVLTTSRDYDPFIIHGDFGPDETITAVDHSHVSPDQFELNQNYPNPFNPTTTISYQLAKNSDVLLTIYSQTGQKVRTLVQEKQGSGFQLIHWDGCDDAGQRLSSGIYLYHLQVDNQVQTRKLMLMK